MGACFVSLVALLSLGLLAISPSADAFAPQPSVSSRRGIALHASDDASKERRPWEFLRFVSQSSKFVTPPPLPFLGGGRKGEARKAAPGETLWSPSSSDNIFSFAPLDDVVMGGASSSTADNNTGMWSGTVTDANSGGFVGIRSTPFRNGAALDMSGCKGVELRLRKGGGKRFKFVVRDSTEFNGICWTTEFDAGGTVQIPFSKQIPTVFAKTVPGTLFDEKSVVGFQVAYSKFGFDGQLNKKFDLGEFALQILELKAY
ncbi:hypothetical protein ACHAXT_003909 [Thalassiosira profunda]